tara:strand:+ start:259 stop:480 length:222 start_codon:yes stop_codon:yes gene_type:complete
MTKFAPGDLIERRIDNDYYYKQMKVNPEYGIIMEMKEQGAQIGAPREWVKVLWVGNEPRSDWHIVSPRLLKVE